MDIEDRSIDIEGLVEAIRKFFVSENVE